MDSKKVALLELEMGWSFWLTQAHLPFSIGRSLKNDLINASAAISRYHCTITMANDHLHIVDTGSRNGVILNNRVIQDEASILSRKTCLALSNMLVWITPCDETGNLTLGSDNDWIQTEVNNMQGVFLVDICDSMQFELEILSTISQELRSVIIGYDPEQLIFLKNMGDGYLAIFRELRLAVTAVERLLKWQLSKKNTHKVDIRIALEAGMTYPSQNNDRIGFPICCVERIEKTQNKDIVVPGIDLKKLKSRNRCLMTGECNTILLKSVQDMSTTYIGERKIKGLENDLYSIYQYDF